MLNLYTRASDKKRLNFIIKNIQDNIGSSASILDVGCGNGIISSSLAKQGYTVLGIDLSEKAIATAKKNSNLPNLTFMVMGAEELVSSKNQYEVIICSEVLEHLDDPSSLLSKLYLSLKDSGILIVTVPNGKGPREVFVTKPVIYLREKNSWGWRTILKAKKIFGYSGSTIQSDADNLDHVQFFSKNDLTNLLEKNLFKLVKFGKANFIDDVFPFSFFSNKIKFLQEVDCKVADYLPYQFTGGFNTVWKKGNSTT